MIPPHLSHVVTLPCEILLSAFEYWYSAGNVAMHLRYGAISNDYCIANVLRIREFWKSVNSS